MAKQLLKRVFGTPDYTTTDGGPTPSTNTAPPDLAVVQPQTAVARARAYVRDVLDTGGTHQQPSALVDEVIELLRSDPAWLADFLEARLRETARALVLEVFARTRPALPVIAPRLPHLTPPTKLQPKRVPKRTDWANWFERTKTGGHIKVIAMTGAQLIEAKELRLQAAERDLRIVGAWDFLIARVQPEQRVGDVFTPEQLQVELDRIAGGSTEQEGIE